MRHDPLSNCLSGSCWLLQPNGNTRCDSIPPSCKGSDIFQSWNEILYHPQKHLAWTDLNPCTTFTPLNIPPYCKGTISDSSPNDCSISVWCHHVINFTEGNNTTQWRPNVHSSMKRTRMIIWLNTGCVDSSECPLQNIDIYSEIFTLASSWSACLRASWGKKNSLLVCMLLGVEEKWPEKESCLRGWNCICKKMSVHFLGINIKTFKTNSARWHFI